MTLATISVTFCVILVALISGATLLTLRPSRDDYGRALALTMEQNPPLNPRYSGNSHDRRIRRRAEYRDLVSDWNS